MESNSNNEIITKAVFDKDDLRDKVESTIGKDLLLETFLTSLSEVQTRLLSILLASGYIEEIGVIDADFGRLITQVLDLDKVLATLTSRKVQASLLHDNYRDLVGESARTVTHHVDRGSLKFKQGGVPLPNVSVKSNRSAGN